MKISPKSEEEVAPAFDLLPKGEYPFTVLESGEIPSKSAKNKGRMMFAVKLNVHGPKGDRHVYDYFADWFSEWKLRHFCGTTGLQADYDKGEVTGQSNAFAGRTGYVKVDIQPAGNYPARNVVSDYVVKGEAKAASPNEPPRDDSDVPF